MDWGFRASLLSALGLQGGLTRVEGECWPCWVTGQGVQRQSHLGKTASSEPLQTPTGKGLGARGRAGGLRGVYLPGVSSPSWAQLCLPMGAFLPGPPGPTL